MKTLRLILALIIGMLWANQSALAGDREVKFGGRVQNDWTFMDADDALTAKFGEFEDGTEFRRARLFASGTLYEHVIFKIQLDFASGEAEFKDVFMGLKGIPGAGTLQVGHFKEPMGLEELTSSKYITFLERALTATFLPSRNTGIGVSNSLADNRVTCAVGVFRDTDGFGEDTGDGEYNFTGRVTALPYIDEETGNLIHLGVSGSHRNPNDDMVSYSQRPAIHLAPKFVKTGEIVADAVNIIAGEVAAVIGPVPVQAEYVHAVVDGREGDDPAFGAYYVQAGIFLTGERRPYKASSAVFDRVKPKTNFFDGSDGKGAWEAAVRFSALDLSDGMVTGGEMEDLTVALNWYMNAHTRVMLNYVHAVLKGLGNADAVLARFQVDF